MELGTWKLKWQQSHMQLIKMVRFIHDLPEGKIRDFCSARKNQVKIIEEVIVDTFSVGTYKYLPEVPDIIVNALRCRELDVNDFDTWQYLRLLKKSKLYVSEMYGKVLQTLSSAIQYSVHEEIHFGIVVC